jgi:hypothetical protein
MVRRVLLIALVAFLLLRAEAGAQSAAVKSSELASFRGIWVITMTNPAGAQETLKIWDKEGVAAATVQLGKFPPTDVTGMLKDGEMPVLTATRRENGKPIRVVMSVVVDGETMKLAQMLEFSETIKRGVGKKQ